MEWWIWITLGIALCIAEMVVPSFFILFFGFGAIITGGFVATGFLEPLSIQILVFTVLSVALALFFRSSLMKIIDKQSDSPQPDSLVGEWAVAKVEIAPGEIGKVELRGASWDGQNSGTSAIAAGERCQVQKVNSLTLVVMKKKDISE